MALIMKEDVLRWCGAPDRKIIGGFGRSTMVIKVGTIAVKFGAVHPQEADNQREVRKLADPRVFTVPEVFLFFVEGDDGYLAMEYIEGWVSDFADAEHYLAVKNCIEHLHTFSSSRPGPALGGPSRAILWPEDDPPVLESASELEAFINSRLVDQKGDFSISNTTFCLCHLDIAPRNFLFTADKIVLLDYASAGYYPRTFEVAALRRNNGFQGMDRAFSRQVEEDICATEPLSQDEIKQVDHMLEFAFNHVRYDFNKAVRPSDRMLRRRRRIKSTNEQMQFLGPEALIDPFLSLY